MPRARGAPHTRSAGMKRRRCGGLGRRYHWSNEGAMPRVNWKAEVDVLRDMGLGASRNHMWTAEALRDRISRAEAEHSGIFIQRALIAKLAQEAASAVEDVGALAWSIRYRRRGGILRQYLGYQTSQVNNFY